MNNGEPRGHTSRGVRRQIGLVGDQDASRYPVHYETRSEVLDVLPLSEVDPGLLAMLIVDSGPTPKPLGGMDVPVLIRFAGQAPASTWATLPSNLDWLPLQPWPYAAEVAAARTMLAQPRRRSVVTGHLASGTGTPRGTAWDDDQWWARGAAEAAIGGMLVAEQLVGEPVTSTRVVTISGSVHVLQYTLSAGIAFTHTIAPERESGLSWLSGDLIAAGTRIGINLDFAPGVLTVWEDHDAQFRFPNVQVDKANIQAPDTIRGGWALCAQIDWTLSSRPVDRADKRADAARVAELLPSVTA